MDAAMRKRAQRRFGFMQMMYWGFYASFASYIVTLLSSRGYNSAEIGLLTAAATCSFLIGQSVLGAVADATRKNRTLYMMCCCCAYAACLGLYFANSLWQVTVVMFLLGLFRDPGSCMLDSWIIKHYEGDMSAYGPIRSCGSIFYAIFMLGYGFVLDHFGMVTLPVCGGVFLVLCLASALSMPELPRLPHQPQQSRERGSTLAALRQSASPLIVIALVVFFLLGVCVPPVLNFVPIALQGLGGTVSLLGILYFCSAGTEYIFMRGGLPFVRTFHAYGRLLISTGLYVAATLIIAFANQPWMLMGTMVLNGAAYGLQLPARRELVARMVPERFQTSVHGVLDMLYGGFGAMTGNALVGAAIDGSGLRTAMLICAGLQLLAGCAVLAANIMSRRGVSK